MDHHIESYTTEASNEDAFALKEFKKGERQQDRSQSHAMEELSIPDDHLLDSHETQGSLLFHNSQATRAENPYERTSQVAKHLTSVNTSSGDVSATDTPLMPRCAPQSTSEEAINPPQTTCPVRARNPYEYQMPVEVEDAGLDDGSMYMYDMYGVATSEESINVESSSRPADRAGAASSILSKTDYVEQWQHSTVASQRPLEHTQISDFYRDTMRFYSTILSAMQEQEPSGNNGKILLERDYHLLKEWGSAYAVSDNHLDHLGNEAYEMTETVMTFLVEICSILVKRISVINGEWSSEANNISHSTEQQVRNLLILVQELSATDNRSETSEYCHSGSSSASDTLEQCAEDLHEYVQLLNELHPSIETFLPLSEEVPRQPEPDQAEPTAPMIFSDIIQSKYKKAPGTLVETLGRLNFERFNRMAASREYNLVATEESSDMVDQGEKSTAFHDSGLGTSVPSNTVPSVVAPSIAFTLAGKSRSRLPPLPQHARPFPCNFCGKTVTFNSRHAWQQHLLQDLQPYSCLELNCPHSGVVFTFREDWMKHLEAEHGIDDQSSPRLCQLCHSNTGSGKVEICKHYADHLEDIAIAASPLEVADEGDTDGGSDDALSQEPIRIKASGLATIEEEEEEGDGRRPAQDSETVDEIRSPLARYADDFLDEERDHPLEHLRIFGVLDE